MAISIRSKPRDRLRLEDVELLGTVRGWRFVTHGGKEYLVNLSALDPEAVARPVESNEIRIHEPRENVIDGTVMHSTAIFRGLEVPAGSYAKAAATGRPRHPGPKRHRPIVASPPPSAAPTSRPLAGPGLSPTIVMDGRPFEPVQVTTIKRTADWAAVKAGFRRRKITFTLRPDRLGFIPSAPGGTCSPDDHLRIWQWREFILAELLEGIVPCLAGTHPKPVPAVAVLDGGTAACADCLAKAV